MKVTEIRINIKKDTEDTKLKAFVTVTFDNEFVVRDLKLIEGKKGLFVAMPSVRVTESCPHCHKKNALQNKFCSECGQSLQGAFQIEGPDGKRREEHRDIAHPISAAFRDYLQTEILHAYYAESNRSADSHGDSVSK